MVCVRLRYTPRERSTERAFIPSLLFFFSFLSAHLVALSYSSRPVHARARVVVVVVVVVGGGVLCGVREVLFSDCCVVHSLGCFRGRGRSKKGLSFPGEKKKKKRRESESETFVDFVCLFFLASRPLRKIQIVWPIFILFVRMDQHPPPQRDRRIQRSFPRHSLPRLLLADPPLLDDDDFDDFDDFDDVDDECDDDEKKVLPVWRLQTTTEEKRDAIDLSTAGTKK